jgi:NAD(P)-dependent dehydrogenase (short-subunit alcohol dehydrogenase family)
MRRQEKLTVDRFGQQTTADEVLEGVDLSGKRVLVTGVSAGLGLETARALSAHGAFVVGAARDLAKAKQITKAVVDQAAKGGGLELIELNSRHSKMCAPVQTP